MRICPTNVIRPALLEAGVEGMWTPVLDFTSGTSGCQSNCVACGHLCPTAAIRPLSLEERMGLGEFKDKGPVRIGTAFVDKSRCLPWAMDRPCIVCQENCPVSPKAIFTREAFVAVQGAQGPFRRLCPGPPDHLVRSRSHGTGPVCHGRLSSLFFKPAGSCHDCGQ